MGDTEKEMVIKIYAQESKGAVWAQKRDASPLQNSVKESFYSANNDIWTEIWRMQRNWQQRVLQVEGICTYTRGVSEEQRNWWVEFTG